MAQDALQCHRVSRDSLPGASSGSSSSMPESSWQAVADAQAKIQRHQAQVRADEARQRNDLVSEMFGCHRTMFHDLPPDDPMTNSSAPMSTIEEAVDEQDAMSVTASSSTPLTTLETSLRQCVLNDVDNNNEVDQSDSELLRRTKTAMEAGVPLVEPSPRRHSGPATVDQDRTIIELLLTKTRLQNLERMFDVEHKQHLATREKCDAMQSVVRRCEHLLAAFAEHSISPPKPSLSIDADDL